MMRVAMIVPGFSATADDWAIPVLQNLFTALARRYEVQIFSLRYPTAGLYRWAGLTHQAVGGGQRYGRRVVGVWLALLRLVGQQHRQTPFDLVHAFWADEPGFLAGLLAGYLRRPLVISLGGWDLTDLPTINYGAQRIWSRRLMVRFALSRADLILAQSAYQQQQCWAHRLPASKVRLAPAGVDLDRFQPATPDAELSTRMRRTEGHPTCRTDFSPFRLIQAASLVPVKNQLLLFDVMRQLKQKWPAIQLNLAGSGPLQPALMALADQFGVTEAIRWHHQLPYPAMVKLYQSSHIYVQSSWHESQGLAVLEAMACGLPAVGTPVGILPEVAAQPPSWLASTLAAQINSLLTDRERYRQASQQARQVVARRFSLAGSVEQLSRLYGEVVETQ